MHKPLTRIVASAFSLIAIAAGANANAQATIDQGKALAGNVTPDDTPGFPITISEPGSYKLTSNLHVPSNVSGVEITASGVTLDLNGFVVSSRGMCVRNYVTYAVSCNGSGNERGVDFMVGGNTLRNGKVRGFGFGVRYIAGDLLENLQIEHNMFSGVATGATTNEHARTLIRGVRVELNGGHGIAAGDALIQGSTAASNGKNGFDVQNGVVLDSVAYGNKGVGFQGANLAIGRNVAQFNKGGNFVGYTTMGGNINGYNTGPAF